MVANKYTMRKSLVFPRGNFYHCGFPEERRFQDLTGYSSQVFLSMQVQFNLQGPENHNHYVGQITREVPTLSH